MSRKGTQEQNDIPLIIGTLPKRLQNKITANCSHAAEDADVENAEPLMVATTRQITILNKSCTKGNGVINKPVLDTSGSENRQKDLVIPGILRLHGIEKLKDNVISAKGVRRRGQPIRLQQRGKEHQAPASPLACVRLTTEHPPWFDNLLEMFDGKQIIQLYDQLMVLQQRNVILNNWKNFCYVRNKLQGAFRHLLLEQVKFVCEHKVDAFFWKVLFYNVREYLKQQHTELANSHVLMLIEQAVQFYITLHDSLMGKSISTRCESVVKVVAQRLLICLGDLARYRANHLQTTDFMEANKYYERAQEMVPGNGAPYNQLAIIAIYHHKRFDAVYYYMRSLLTSNAIETAKESLLDLFDDIRRKYEENELKQSPMHYVAAGTPKKCNKIRKEVWIYPDGVRRLHRTDVKGKMKFKATVAEVNRYDEMPPEELLPRISSLYLYLIGKLYTGIDVECLYQQLRKLQIQLEVALKYNFLTRSKLLKMLVLNIFVLEHNKRKATRREMRYHSFNFTNSFFGLMLSKANHLLATLTEEPINSQSLAPAELYSVNTCLQCIKVYVQWLNLNVDLWEPVRTDEHSFVDCWAELQTLFDHIACIRSQFKNEYDEDQTIALDEDITLNGFDPLGRDTGSRECTTRGSESKQFPQRIIKIANFQKCYRKYQHNLQLPMNSNFTNEDLNAAMQVALNEFDSESCAGEASAGPENGKTGPNIDEQSEASTSNNAGVSHLFKLKKALEQKAMVKQNCSTKLAEILKIVDSTLYIEVRPRYLLPDTNCFIDCLEDIEKLSTEFKRYIIIIPLTVVKELDGLSKGVKLDTYRNSNQKHRIHHFDDVSTCAKKSLDFIKSAKNNVKCATSKGSIINASLFALVEEEYASNDDKILATAIAVSKTASSEQCKEGKCFIQTELVLITTDRNLRVKALARNMAVSALDEFLQWAKDCRKTT